MRRVFDLNGPNLGRLGKRQPEIYGRLTHVDLVTRLVEHGRGLGLDVDVRQTDYEGRYIEWLHEAADDGIPCVLNAGAWTHYSHAVADAAALVTYVEVHISNVHAREEFRRHSVLSAKAAGIIIGCGPAGYDLALSYLAGTEAMGVNSGA